MMITYFNLKTNYGVETVDYIDSKDYPSFKAFKLERSRLRSEYLLSGMNIYYSQRSTNEWRAE